MMMQPDWLDYSEGDSEPPRRSWFLVAMVVVVLALLLLPIVVARADDVDFTKTFEERPTAVVPKSSPPRGIPQLEALPEQPRSAPKAGQAEIDKYLELWRSGGVYRPPGATAEPKIETWHLQAPPAKRPASTSQAAPEPRNELPEKPKAESDGFLAPGLYRFGSEKPLPVPDIYRVQGRVAKRKAIVFTGEDVYGKGWCRRCGPFKEKFGTGDGETELEYSTAVATGPDLYPAIRFFDGVDWRYPADANGGYTIPETLAELAAIMDRATAKAPKVAAAVNGEASPTPYSEVVRVIGLLPKPTVGFVDFGCGDARWCIVAAERWGCRVTGIEIDPVRAAAARERVREAGLSHLIEIIEGDAVTTDVQADVGVGYLYIKTLQQLRPRIEKLRAFASYQHQPPVPSVRNGDSWVYTRPTAATSQSTQQRMAVWNGQYYAGPVCNAPNCGMCQSIRSQLYGRSGG